jgi:hypothetical protein
MQGLLDRPGKPGDDSTVDANGTVANRADAAIAIPPRWR